MEETNVDVFEAFLTKSIEQLKSSNTTNEFLIYFSNHYVDRKEQWAACYRRRCGINTNMYVESFHRLLQYVYMRGQCNRRVDKLLYILMNIARDKGFERICKLEKGKITGQLSIIRKRRVESTKMQTEIITQHSATEWGVESSDKTQVYTVCLEVMTCPFKCELKCNQCNICVHTYTFSCNDSLHNHTICKHIHLVAYNMDREIHEQGCVPSDTHDLFLAQATRTHVLNTFTMYMTVPQFIKTII